MLTTTLAAVEDSDGDDCHDAGYPFLSHYLRNVTSSSDGHCDSRKRTESRPCSYSYYINVYDLLY